MHASNTDALLAWIAEHPVLAGLVIFAVAFLDALLVIGLAFPSLPVLFGVGTLIALGVVNPWYAIACAALGAFLGDGASYLIGRHYGQGIRGMWPFSRHPQWLMRGEIFFRRHGVKGIFIARYVGAVRCFVPVIAGMVRMPGPRYVVASALAAVTWAVGFMLPGWVFGASIDLLGRIAGRAAVVLGLLLLVLALIGGGIFAAYRVLAPRAASFIERLLAWSHRHPVLGRISESLIDPRRRESGSLAQLALALAFAGWSFFTLLLLVGGGGEPLRVDMALHELMFALRNPLADVPMAMAASIGDWPVLGAGVAVVFAWLAWRRRWIAAWHWLAAPGFGLLLVAALGFGLDVPRPPAALNTPGFGFPSAPVTLSVVVFGFFAVLVARELPGRRRAWPYVVAGVLVGLVGFARIYLGAHWLSDVLAGVLLGVVFITGLGLAYRRRVLRSFWARPLSLTFFATVLVVAGWHAPRVAPDVLARFEPPLLSGHMSRDEWWSDGWQRLPSHRDERPGTRSWALNIEYAGDLDDLRERLETGGWQVQAQAGWMELLEVLAANASPDEQAILPAAHQGRAESLLLSAPGQDAGHRYALRLWRSGYALAPGEAPLYVGVVQSLRFTQRFNLVSFWETVPVEEAEARAHLRAQLEGLRMREGARDPGGPVVLRVDGNAEYAHTP